jgi:hypothetical protein
MLLGKENTQTALDPLPNSENRIASGASISAHTKLPKARWRENSGTKAAGKS